MSMTDTDTRGTDAPKPEKKKRRRYVRRKRRSNVVSKETTKPALGEYAGISAADCCGECTEARCVITHVGICGHPMKGGLQAAFKMKSDVVARYNRANKILAHAKLDLRFS